MQDDFASLFPSTGGQHQDARCLPELTPEQYAAEPVPGWSSVAFTATTSPW